MLYRRSARWSLALLPAAALVLAAATLNANNTSGSARAAQASTIVGTAVLADTGTLNTPGDARHASQTTGALGSIVSGDALHATTIAWSDQVASEASMGSVNVAAGPITVAAGFVMARASAGKAANGGSSSVADLTINGFPALVTGEPNQRIDVAGATIVVNEQTRSAGAFVVNGLHIYVDGVADVVIASASAKAQ